MSPSSSDCHFCALESGEVEKMVKSASNLRLFFKKGATSNDLAIGDMENRAPLSPISLEARNKSAQGNSNQPQGFPATPLCKKLSSSSLCQKYPNAENVENLAAGPPGTPDHNNNNKSTTTPKSVAKKRFGWNPRPQAQHEEASSGSLHDPHSLISSSLSCVEYWLALNSLADPCLLTLDPVTMLSPESITVKQ